MRSEEYAERIYQVIYAIPAGRVATYGQVAALAGLPGRARLVGRTLKHLPEGTRLPWHRVINSQGKISLPETSPGHSQQISRLQNEGVCVLGGRISLRDFGWKP